MPGRWVRQRAGGDHRRDDLLGVNEALTSTLLGGQYVLITQFLLIILVLLIRPRGIAGILDKAREA